MKLARGGLCLAYSMHLQKADAKTSYLPLWSSSHANCSGVKGQFTNGDLPFPSS